MTNKTVITPEYKSVIQSIESGAPCIFISGEAGSGKTTLLHYMTTYFTKAKKEVALVAPTGIAALQAGGSTINSFFRFPARILLASDIKKSSDPSLYKALHILFVDEVSMVRADMVDAMDAFLRRARSINKPFGGVQVVFIGDLYQLPPVVTTADKPILTELGYVTGHYFFNAKVFTQIAIRNIALTQVFRQKDDGFKKMLNKVRVAEDSVSVSSTLNSHCFLEIKKQHPLAITLATTNAIADDKNIAELSRLKETPVIYKGEFEGDFKFAGSNLPALEKLVLKVGAVVLFTANDKDDAKRWVNGTLGKVIKLNKSNVEIQTESGSLFVVEPYEWKSYDYTVVGGKISQKETGKYKQYPLTLGWAITIHKSQGKTLNHLHINLGTGAFATGQTYVALSRAVNLEGMTFERPVRASDIKCCALVKAYLNPEFSLS